MISRIKSIMILSAFGVLITLSMLNCGKSEPEVIKIGAILPLTGVASELGNYYREGIILAVEDINQAGGINNRKIDLSIEDSKTSPREAVTVLQKLLSTKEKPKFIFAHLSGISLAIAPITDNHKIPLLSVATADDIIEKHNYTVRNYISARRLALFSDKFFSDSLKIKSFGILFINDNFGRSTSSEFSKRTLSRNGTVLFNEAYEGTASDFRTLVLKLKDSNPEAAYIIGYGKPLGLIIKQLREAGYKGKILSGAEVAYPDVINMAGKYIEGVIFVDLPFHIDLNSTYIQNFVNRYTRKFNRLPTTPSALAYDGMKLMMYVYAKSGDNIDLFMKNINNIKNRESLNGNIDVSKRDIEYPFVLKKIKNKASMSYTQN